MNKVRSVVFTLLIATACSRAATLTENFATDPLKNGWQIFGDTNLFQWDSTHQNLDVTWDSSQPNSYFYKPLGTTLTTNDDFSMAFDLRLDDVETTGYGDEITVSLFKLADATRTNLDRVAGADPVLGPDNVFEFDYFNGTGNETISPTMISGTDTGYDQWATGFFFPDPLTNGVVFHIALEFSAVTQSISTTITYGNNLPWMSFSPVTTSPTFTGVEVDTIAVSSYDGNSDPYDSSLAHGVIGNLRVTYPLPVENLAMAVTNGTPQVQFDSRIPWVYTLERSVDLHTWSDASTGASGNGNRLELQDTNAVQQKAFYRVRASLP